MKISLIYPGITECGFNSLKGNEGSWMHHGLAIISSCLKAQGHQVGLIDLRRLMSWSHFEQVVRDGDAQLYGITMMSVDFNPATRAADLIKKHKPGALVMVGGPHPSICPEELEPLPAIDFIVKGEGEITVPKLVAALERGETWPRQVEGQRLEDLDQAPWADRKLFQAQEEPFVSFLPAPFVTLIAGRGCRYNCNYCQPAERMIFGHRVRRRSVSSFVAELNKLRQDTGFNSFMIHDDCLTEDRSWVLEFCRKLEEHQHDKPFVCQSRADIICRNPDMVEALRQAGLSLMIIGFESGSDRVLRFLRKGCTREQNLEAARICQGLGIKIWANYMLGLPGETKEEVLETYSMLEQIMPYHCSPAFYTPHPGSDLYEIGREMGIHLITSHDSYRRNTLDAKIKGPDYNFLRDVLYRSIELGEDMRLRRQAARQVSAAGVEAAASPGTFAGQSAVPLWSRYGWPRWRGALRDHLEATHPGILRVIRNVKRMAR